MRYSDITTCDIVNGLGIGVVLWCQGCDLHCPGCHNPETWEFDAGKPYTKQTLETIKKEISKPYISRFTLSGGHPLAPKNLEDSTALCKALKEFNPKITIWVYTGYTYENIKNYEILKYTDVLVDGSFFLEQRDITLPFRGSANQRIIDVQKSLKENDIILYE